ncbi:hypothetical protein C2S53_006090 [Perilla frutescens var. hirtella]|uniref:Uncharacterized protein n=1 Tax=Perilla frutescens var. hirtella TaxID=608512 RepID=A0AAD4PDK3_PERFH|nr:hypothetical protein C2S53_006090 [Perilla frutescens var. hirtella]
MTLLTPPPIDVEDEQMLVPHADFAPEGPQPMEVAPAEATNIVDAQAVDEPPSARFTWRIENFSKLNHSNMFEKFDSLAPRDGFVDFPVSRWGVLLLLLWKFKFSEM